MSALPTPLVATALRELDAADLVALEADTVGATTPPLARIRSVHHTIARLLAAGRKAVEISAVTGVSQSRISILQNDPAFRDLLQHYAAEEASAFADVRERMLELGLSATEELHERVLNEPENIGTKTLVEIMTATLDRGGHAPKSEHRHIHAVLSKEDIAALKAAAQSGGVVFREAAVEPAGDLLQAPSGVGGACQGEAA